MKKKLNMKKIIFILTAFGVAAVVFFYLVTSTWIGMGVREKCSVAQKMYTGDCVEALISYVDDSDNHTLRKRNQAVWALGQLGDNRALPILEKYLTGEECDHEKFMCQYELEKAIKLVSGGFNITHFVWRRSIN